VFQFQSEGLLVRQVPVGKDEHAVMLSLTLTDSSNYTRKRNVGELSKSLGPT